MGVYIKNMEMPTFEQGDITLRIRWDGIVEQDSTGNRIGTAISVPPHGRLIDADALEDNNITYYAIPVLANVTDGAVREAELVIRLKDLDNAPTVIPANERKIK